MDFTTLFDIERLMSSLAMTLMHFLWQAALIALVLKIVLSISKKQALKFRYYSAVAALSACAILPAFTFVSSYHQVDLPAASDSLPIQQVVLPVVNQPISSQFALEQSSGIWAQIGQYFDYQLLVAIWACGVLFMFAKLIYDLKQTYRLTREGTSLVDDEIVEMVKQISTKFGITRSVRILKSSLVNVPVVIGWFKPTVLLPIAITIGLDRQQLELIIAHELAHVKRLDFLVNLVQGFIQVIFFYHPSIYWINKVVREEREYICDSMALTALNNSPTARLELAKALLNIEELKEGNLQLVAVAASDGHLKNRINRIVLNERLRMPSARGVLVAALALLFSFTAIAVTADMSASLNKNQQVQAPKKESQQINPSVALVSSRNESTESVVDKRPAVTQPTLNPKPSTISKSVELTGSTDSKSSAVVPENVSQKSISATDNRIAAAQKTDAKFKSVEAKVDTKVTQSEPSINELAAVASQSTNKAQTLENAETAIKQQDVESENQAKKSANKIAKLEQQDAIKSPIAVSQPEKEFEANNQLADNSPAPVRVESVKLALIEKKPTSAFKEPIALKTPYPVYPAGAFKNNLKGRVRVDFVIDEEGRVINPSFNDGTPWIFSREIRSKLKRWRYVPAEKNGQRIAYSSSVYFDFELPEREPLTHYQVGSRIKRKIR